MGEVEQRRSEPSISIVVPTYNESDNIVEVIDRVRAILADCRYEILVVDDDSPDGTWRIADRHFREHDEVVVHRRIGERGLATAVAYGFERCRNEFCAVIDADLQHPPEHLPVLLRHVTPETDVVVASRYTDFGRIQNWPPWRRFVSVGATTLAKTVLPSIDRVTDPLSGFFVVRRSVLQRSDFAPTGYKILLEILIRCEYDRLEEVPYVFTDRERGESNLTVREYVAFLKHLASLRAAA